MKIINLDVKKVTKQLDLFAPVAAWEIEILKDINDTEKTVLETKRTKIKLVDLKHYLEEELISLSWSGDVILISEIRKKISMQKDYKEICEWLNGIDEFIDECELVIKTTKTTLEN